MHNIDSSLNGDQYEVDDQRLNIEWTTAIATRETFGIAQKGSSIPTYMQTLALCRQLLPKLFDDDHSILLRQQQSTGVQMYRQKATGMSLKQGRIVTPLEAVNLDINELEELIAAALNQPLELIQNQLRSLRKIRQELKELEMKKYTEQQLILRDVSKTHRNLPLSGEGKDYREFGLSNGRVLRIRMLHPDPPEASIGADVLYESYWDKKKMVRLAAIQYKRWNGSTLYESTSGDLKEQLEKLEKAFCAGTFCTAFAGGQRTDAYRLPYCAAFLRPTDQLQLDNVRLISSGYHVPVCVVNRLWQTTSKGGRKLDSKIFRSEAVTHRVFEELFNTNMLGSRWLTYQELEKLYQEHKLLEVGEKIIVHAQEFSGSSNIGNPDDFDF
jgi:hypothetical protein